MRVVIDNKAGMAEWRDIKTSIRVMLHSSVPRREEKKNLQYGILVAPSRSQYAYKYTTHTNRHRHTLKNM